MAQSHPFVVYRSALAALGLAGAAAAVVLLLVLFPYDPWDMSVVLSFLVLPVLVVASAILTPLEARRLMVRSAAGVAVGSALVLLTTVFTVEVFDLGVRVNWLMLVALGVSAGLVATVYAEVETHPWAVRSAGVSAALLSLAGAGYIVWRLLMFSGGF